MAVGLRSLEYLIERDLPTRSRLLGEQGLGQLRALAGRFPGLFQEVRGQGLLLAMQFRPIVGLPLPGALREIVYEGTAILALRELHRAGVMANLSLSSKRVVRLSPALDMPPSIFNEMMDRVERFAQINPTSRHLLTNTPPAITARLAAFAASKPKKRTPSDG